MTEFIEARFRPWAQATFEKASPKTWTGWYRTQLANIQYYSALARLKLDAITSEHAADYAAHLQTKGWLPSSVNSSLRVLRRVLRLAVEWGVIQAAPKIKLLRGEHHRGRVVTSEEKTRYLASAGELIATAGWQLRILACGLQFENAIGRILFGRRHAKVPLSDARTKRVHYERNEETDKTVQVWGDTAVINSKLWLKGVDKGKPFEWQSGSAIPIYEPR